MNIIIILLRQTGEKNHIVTEIKKSLKITTQQALTIFHEIELLKPYEYNSLLYSISKYYEYEFQQPEEKYFTKNYTQQDQVNAKTWFETLNYIEQNHVKCLIEINSVRPAFG